MRNEQWLTAVQRQTTVTCKVSNYCCLPLKEISLSNDILQSTNIQCCLHVYSSVHHKEPLKSFDKSVTLSLLRASFCRYIAMNVAESYVKQSNINSLQGKDKTACVPFAFAGEHHGSLHCKDSAKTNKVTGYFISKQLLLLDFAGNYWTMAFCIAKTNSGSCLLYM